MTRYAWTSGYIYFVACRDRLKNKRATEADVPQYDNQGIQLNIANLTHYFPSSLNGPVQIFARMPAGESNVVA